LQTLLSDNLSQGICPEPIPLASLAGTYRWVFLSQTSWESIEFRYESDPEVVKKEYPGFPGFFKISFPKDEKPSLRNMSGTFRFWDLEGSFIGVTPPKPTGGETIANAWEINYMQWEPHCRDEETVRGHAVEVCNAVDDNGNRFITLFWDQGWSGCSPHSADWVGKKQTDEEALVGLTDAERERTGMYLTDEEVKERATQSMKDIAAEETSNKRKIEGEERDVKRKRKD
jgi:hypothetical protein